MDACLGAVTISISGLDTTTDVIKITCELLITLLVEPKLLQVEVIWPVVLNPA
jgi:hypothetical protein